MHKTQQFNLKVLFPLALAIFAMFFNFLVLTSPLTAQHARTETEAQDRAVVQNAMEEYMEGLIAQDTDRIPLAQDVIFVGPDGSTESTLRGISEVEPFLKRQPVDSIRVHHSMIDGEWGCKLTDYFWNGWPQTPIALCLRVRDGKITEIRPYFDRSLFDD